MHLSSVIVDQFDVFRDINRMKSSFYCSGNPLPCSSKN